MKIAGKILIVTGILLFAISAFGYFLWYKPKFNEPAGDKPFSFEKSVNNFEAKTIARIRQKALLAKGFVNSGKFDKEICFLIDMRLPSGNNRFFVYNLERDSVEITGLVTHGSGSENGTDELEFSNVPNSYKTSLGKYKMGKSYYGKFGLAYKLYGLDNSNSKAFDRFIVLHGHSCVPNDETAPFPICVSLGCPTVSPAFLSTLQNYINQTQASILLWIYY